MPQKSKKRKAAVAREKFKKLPQNVKDPLLWMVEDPWNSEYLRSAGNSTPSLSDIQQPCSSTCDTEFSESSISDIGECFSPSQDIRDITHSSGKYLSNSKVDMVCMDVSADELQPGQITLAFGGMLPCALDSVLVPVQLPCTPPYDMAAQGGNSSSSASGGCLFIKNSNPYILANWFYSETKRTRSDQRTTF